MNLEILKKERAVLRTSISKAHTRIQDALNSDDVSDFNRLSGLLELMRIRFECLTLKDTYILDLMSKDEKFTPELLEEEQNKVDEYAMMFYEVSAAVEKVHQELETHHKGTSVVSNEQSSIHSSGVSHQNRKYKLPVLKLREFSGDLHDWLPFWSQFKKINDDQDLDDTDKLGYLIMSMTPGSSARQLVDSYPATGEMYRQVVQALTDRYGRKDLLTEFYIRELLKMILQNTVKEKLPISVLYDRIQCHMRNLETLGVTTENCASILMPLVSSCLPADLLQIWERNQNSQSSSTSKECLESLLQFLKNEVEGVQKMELAKSGFGMTDSNKSRAERKDTKKMSCLEDNIPTAAGLVNVSNSNKVSCIFCQANHKPQDCKMKISLDEKRKCVNESHVCYCCLKLGHRAARCKWRPKCKLCGKGHYDIMCSTVSKEKTVSNTAKNHALANSAIYSNVLMQTLVVKVYGEDGKTKFARLLIDTGSERSYILSRTAAEMGYVPCRTEKIQHALFGGSVTAAADHNVYKLHASKVDMSYLCNFDVLSQDKICGDVPLVPQGPWITELSSKGIDIKDASSSSEIEILVGSDVAAKLWTGNNVTLTSGLVAMETRLGWTLSGKIPGISRTCTNSVATIVTSMLIKEATISDLWSLDILGITDPTDKSKREIEQATRKHFLDTVKIREDNRYEVSLPWLQDHPPLSNNYQLSSKRLETIIKKLRRDSRFDDYQNVLNFWEDKGIIEKVPIEELGKIGHYLPHHPVIREGSSTPVRPVFDASAKESGKYSLNQCLEKGPNLIEKIPSCLARFRRNKIAVSGDIEKAFLQIGLSLKDRDYLRFLWVDEKGAIQVYRHCRVVFGVSPSPFLLEACIQLHLQDTLTLCKENKSPYPSSYIESLAESFYVDNCLTSLHSVQEATSFIQVASSVMSERMFTLRGWEFTGEKSQKSTNVLGLQWDKEEDTLSININSLLSMELNKITKKVILSAAHRIFDPVGIVSSFALIPKLLLQQTWESNLTWNEEVSEEMRKKFIQWMSEVPLIADVKIPRWIAGSNTPEENYSLHVFSDASKSAYAAAVFLRIKHETEVTVQLLVSRSRVAPSSKTKSGMTIPRLELLAASIAARLHKTIVEDFKFFNVKTIFWTDATTVLAWITRNEPWNVYVMNRIKEIRTLTEGHEWRHIPGDMNPADLPSRGCSMKKLIQCRWWEGPEWLRRAPENWPEKEEILNEQEVNAEKKKTIVSSMVFQSTSPRDYYNYFSQYRKLVRMVGWIQRFRSNIRYKQIHGCLPVPSDLSANEFCAAEEKVMLWVQKEAFTSVDDPRLSKLIPFVDERGLIRIKTKISNRIDDVNFCSPIVLPNAEHPVVHRLIMEEHISGSHAGAQTLLSILRRNYWILGGRRTVKSVVNTCVICKRHMVKRLEVVPTPLPESRVRDARVFEITGVDFAGPLFIKDGNGSVKKAWVCLFTCAVYRAVRVELVSTLSTNGFVQALRRFVSYQGRPSIIYSDCGTNFCGFDNACDELDWDKIYSYSSVRRIEWRKNPPGSPWWGGWWERMIALLKTLLRRVLGRISVDYEELQTILCECEAIINSRPLTYLSENASDLSCITPSMFLHDLMQEGVPEYEFIQTGDLKRRLKYCQDLRKQLCERFRLEYLGQLQLFANKKKKHDLKLGEIVLVGDDRSKRINWPLGRIIELIPGMDGHVRVVKVRTSAGVLTRAVQRIYPLEFKCSSDDLTPVLEGDENDRGEVPNASLNSEMISPTKIVPAATSPIRESSIVLNPNEPETCFKTSRSGRTIRIPKKIDL